VGGQKVIPRLVGCSRPKAKIGRERETQILNVAPLRYCFPFLRDFRSKTFLLYYCAAEAAAYYHNFVLLGPQNLCFH
jgi:hypothetical protein